MFFSIHRFRLAILQFKVDKTSFQQISADLKSVTSELDKLKPKQKVTATDTHSTSSTAASSSSDPIMPSEEGATTNMANGNNSTLLAPQSSEENDIRSESDTGGGISNTDNTNMDIEEDSNTSGSSPIIESTVNDCRDYAPSAGNNNATTGMSKEDSAKQHVKKAKSTVENITKTSQRIDELTGRYRLFYRKFACINLILELQKLFARMIWTNKRCVDPSNVLKWVLDNNDKSDVVGLQQDVFEFYTRMLTQIEEVLSTTVIENEKSESSDKPNLIRKLFYVDYIEKYSAKDRNGSNVQVTNKCQDFCTTLNVKHDLRNLYTSLDAHTSEERIPHFFTNSGHQTTALKSTWFRKLSPVLIFRIEVIY